MPYQNEHAARIKTPGKRYKRFRRQNDRFGEGVHAIWGVLKRAKKEGPGVELQALRFDARKFTPGEARAWIRQHSEIRIPLEPAKRR
jgi:hypothetical protein